MHIHQVALLSRKQNWVVNNVRGEVGLAMYASWLMNKLSHKLFFIVHSFLGIQIVYFKIE